jgi:hypothetical protein
VCTQQHALTQLLCLSAGAAKINKVESLFDFAEKKRQLLAFLGAGRDYCLPEDEALHSILKSNDFNVERAAFQILTGEAEISVEPMSMQRDADKSCSAGCASGCASKRARSEQLRTTPPSTPISSPAAPFVTAALGGASSSTSGNVAAMDAASAGILMALSALKIHMDGMQQTLPRALAAAVPAAVRAHDEAEAVRARKAAVETGLGAIVFQIHAAYNMAALGRIDGFRWDLHENSQLHCVCV